MLKFRATNFLFVIFIVVPLLLDRSLDLPVWYYGLVVLGYLVVQVYGTTVMSAQFFMPAKFKGDSSDSIALTFDDGPVPGNTETILNILESRNIRAAFFCIGNRVADNPALTKRVFDAGHLIGNHSYWHRATFDLQTADKIAKELRDTDEAIQQAIGRKPNLFRPPYGVTNPMVARAVKKGGYTTIGWSVRSFDTVIRDGEVLKKRITRSLKGGDVILLHDYSNTTLEILPALLDHIASIGLKIVRVDELLNQKAYG
jgi:peptidoglycan/xylan/chitin deacetylase (PgdA/CDA1 family)